MRITAFLLPLFLFINFFASAQVIRLNEETPYQNIGKQLSYYRDETAKLDLKQVMKLDSSKQFVRGTSDVINFRNTKSAVWLKISYLQDFYEDVALVVDVPTIERVDCYILTKDGGVISRHSGAFAKEMKGVRIANNYTFKMPDPKNLGKPATVYLRLQTNNYLLVPIKLGTVDTIVKGQASRDRLESLYTGMLITLLLFNIFLFISVKDNTYLYYSVYVLTLTIYVSLYLRGYAYLLGDSVRFLVFSSPHAFLSISIIGSILFCRKFLNLEKTFPKVLKVYWAMIGVATLMFLTSILGYKTASAEISKYLTILISLILWGTGFVVYRRGLKAAKFYIIAWFSLGITLIIVTLSTVGVLPVGDYTFELVPIGSALELLLLSFALGDRYKSMLRNEKKVVALKASNEVKNKLFSIISHDLRSPLNSLMSILTLKDVDALSLDEIKYLLDENRKNIETINTTLNNLLHWSKSQMDGIKTEPVAFDISMLIDELMLVYMPLIQEKGIQTQMNLQAGLKVYADQDQVKLILRNLIDNAIKFTTKGNELGCSLKQVKNKVEICLYNQTNDTSGIFNNGGTGLGLQLCREYVSNNGSELEISCGEGKVYFCFELPAV